MKNFRRVVFFVCVVALVGLTLLPTNATLQSGGKKSTIQSTPQLPLQRKIGTQEDWDNFLDLKARIESLTGEELLLYKQLNDVLGPQYERQQPGDREQPQGVAAVGGETCAAAPLFTTSFFDSDDTTGHVDDLDPSMSTTCPATGGGSSFTSTGLGPDLVYRLNSPTAVTVTAGMDPTGTDDLAIYVISPGPCPAGMFAAGCIVGDDSGGGGSAEQVTFAAAAGVDYFIVVDGFAGADGPYDLAVITNDACEDATVIPATPFMATQSVVPATGGTAPDPNPSCVGTHSRTVWYTYTPAGNEDVTISTAGSDYDTGLTVWCPPCPTPTEEVACNDDFGGTFQSQVTFRANGGQQYLIEVWDFGVPGPGGMLSLSVTSAPVAAPANDDCANATPVTLTGRNRFIQCVDTTGAADECGETCLGSRSIWYLVTAQAAGNATFSTRGQEPGRPTGTNYDTTICVFSDTTCPPSMVLGSNDDISGSDLRSQVTVPVTAGQMVLVQVAGFGGATGRACVEFTLNPSRTGP
jgi:hypothetical protein